MKKKSLFGVLVVAVGAAFGFASCNTCLECKSSGNSYYGGNSQNICKPDYYTKKAWDERVDAIEDQGYDCEPLR